MTLSRQTGIHGMVGWKQLLWLKSNDYHGHKTVLDVSTVMCSYLSIILCCVFVPVPYTVVSIITCITQWKDAAYRDYCHRD